MKILMLAMDYPPNIFAGIGTHVYELSTALTELGVSVDVFVIPHANVISSSTYTVEQMNGHTVYRFLFDDDTTARLSSYGLPTRNELRNIIWNFSTTNVLEPVLNITKDKHYDLIHMHDYFNILIAEAIRDIKGIPIVNTVHAPGTSGKKLHYHLRNYSCLAADRNIVVSSYLEKQLKEEEALKHIEFNVIPNGVSKSLVRDPLKTKKKKRILFVGRLTRGKGCDILLKTFTDLCRNNDIDSEMELVMIGDGPEKLSLQNYCQIHNIEKRVSFLGHLPYQKVRQLMGEAMLLVAPSLYEAFGLVALEAMSEGTCVITSKAGGFLEFVKNRYNAMMVDIENGVCLYSSIKELLSDSNLRNSLATNGYHTSLLMSWKKIAEKTKSIYEVSIQAS